MVFGIVFGTIIQQKSKFRPGIILAPNIFIPIGVIFYGAANLNVKILAEIDASFSFTIFIVFLVYIISTILLSHIFGLKDKIGYLVAAGSAICGASAIAITSKAIDAEPDDISISLVSVFISALIGLFIILPLLAFYFRIPDQDYAVLSGTVLQFTGFVKASVANMPPEIKSIAIAVKAGRYIGLLFVIPLFASFVKGRLHIPWYLWAFLGAGIVFSYAPDVAKTMKPMLKLVLTLLWSSAMGAIGLNTNIDTLFTKNGLKTLGVSFMSFIIATGVFLVALYLS